MGEINVSSKSGNTLDYGIFAYVEYTISSTSTKTTLSVTKAVARTALPNVGMNDMTGKFTDSSKVNATKTVSDKYMRSIADVTMFSSFTWSWDKGTTALSVTVDFKITSDGGTSTASIPVNVPALAKYTISYDGNGATSGSVSSQTKYYGKALTLRTNSFVRTGYTFYKWNTNAAGTGTEYNSGGSYPANANATATMYAQWTPVSYTVTLDANGGVSGSPASISRTYGSSFTILETSIPTRSGYKFLGWAESETVTTATYIHNGETTDTGTCTISSYNAVTGDKILYAVWEVAYNKPEITDLVAYRVDSSTSSSETNEGTYIYVTFDYTKGSINGSYRATNYKITINGTQVESGSLSSNIGTIPTSTVAYGGSYETSTSHTVVVTLSDNQESNYEKAESSVIVSSSIYPIDLIGSGNNVYMGLMHTAISGQEVTTDNLYVDGDISAVDITATGNVTGAGLIGSTVEVGGKKIYELFEVTNETFSMSIAASSYGDDDTQTFTKAGYFPIGIAGWSITGTNGTMCFIPRLYLSSVGAGTCDLFIRVRNTATSTASINLGIRILWIKII